MGQNSPYGAVRDHGHLVLSENERGIDYVVGDIHGQYASLMCALGAVGFDERVDRLIAVGDLIDRGPDSMKCLDLLYQPWFFSVVGNHEDFFLGAFLESHADAMVNLVRNGGQWTLDEDPGDLKAIAADVMAELPLSIEVPFRGKRIGVIHAAVTSGRWGQFELQADIWNRRINQVSPMDEVAPREARVSGIDMVVVGHNVVEAPVVTGNTLNLDAGAARGNDVTLWSLEQGLAAVVEHQATGEVRSTFFEKPRVGRRPLEDEIDLLGLDDNEFAPGDCPQN